MRLLGQKFYDQLNPAFGRTLDVLHSRQAPPKQSKHAAHICCMLRRRATSTHPIPPSLALSTPPRTGPILPHDSHTSDLDPRFYIDHVARVWGEDTFEGRTERGIIRS